ncbi:MAG: hypothetical protein M0Q21_06780 [Ignavibacteriaceae bacterium]|nr:hypothetical protein [Ignavibacteriaceae bacterium]
MDSFYIALYEIVVVKLIKLTFIYSHSSRESIPEWVQNTKQAFAFDLK